MTQFERRNETRPADHSRWGRRIGVATLAAVVLLGAALAACGDDNAVSQDKNPPDALKLDEASNAKSFDLKVGNALAQQFPENRLRNA